MEDQNNTLEIIETKTENNYVLDEKRIYGLLPVIVLIIVVIIRVSFVLCNTSGVYLLFILLCAYAVYYLSNRRHKTRAPQQRRMYAGNRPRPSSLSPEPTIYVSPSNLPPPPKYDQIAPPSYEEVIGIHYPQYQNQPITAPITTAMAHQSNATENAENDVQSTVITVTSDERRTSVTVARS